MISYFRNSIASIVLASMLGGASPDLQANCPEPKQIKELLPDYNLENAVASADIHINLDRMIENKHVRAGAEYSLIIYNSKSKNNKIIEYDRGGKFEQFLKKGEFDVIQFYEMNNLQQIHTMPSAVIYKTENITYVLLDLIGGGNLADGDFDDVICFGAWSSDVLIRAGGIILKKRLEDSIKRDYPPQNPKPKVLKIA